MFLTPDTFAAHHRVACDADPGTEIDCVENWIDRARALRLVSGPLNCLELLACVAQPQKKIKQKRTCDAVEPNSPYTTTHHNSLASAQAEPEEGRYTVCTWTYRQA